VCSRVQPIKVTIDKKDEINEYKKKEIQTKRKRQKEERTSVPLPLSWNIYVKKQCRHINRAGYNNVCELISYSLSNLITILVLSMFLSFL
jgi:hypothetical protein